MRDGLFKRQHLKNEFLIKQVRCYVKHFTGEPFTYVIIIYIIINVSPGSLANHDMQLIFKCSSATVDTPETEIPSQSVHF